MAVYDLCINDFFLMFLAPIKSMYIPNVLCNKITREISNEYKFLLSTAEYSACTLKIF